MKRTVAILSVLLVTLLAGAAFGADLDGDGLEDEWELLYWNSIYEQNGNGDPDGDQLTNEQEEVLETSPITGDTDSDFLSDYDEVNDYGTDPNMADSDSDSLNDFMEILKGYDPNDQDTDGGGIIDGEELIIHGTDPLVAEDDQLDSDGDGITNYCEGQLGLLILSQDSDADWLLDAEEIDLASQEPLPPGQCPEFLGLTDPLDPDSDDDGLEDGHEVLKYDTDPLDEDSDDDGIDDGDEVAQQVDHPCLLPSHPDSDYDGVYDGVELGEGGFSDPCDWDSDNDGLLDVSEVTDQTDPLDADSFAPDSDLDGLSDDYETLTSLTEPTDPDTDGDGIPDPDELFLLCNKLFLDPHDADFDDDGLLDGTECVGWNLQEGGTCTCDTNPNKWDTDGDGLSDGLESGLAAPELSAKAPDATDPGIFVADGDPGTTTNPDDADSDNDGLTDGDEDQNLNGIKENNETDPNVYDTDGDGIDDKWETDYSTLTACPPADAPVGPLNPLLSWDAFLDNDLDGLTNFEEYDNKFQLGKDDFLENSTNPCSKDSDGDGLSDLKETSANYVPGPSFYGTESDPNKVDTDADGLGDGEEDKNFNGTWDSDTETNPLKADTDSDTLKDGFEVDQVNGSGTDPKLKDTDGDGLNDNVEFYQLGTDPNDPDTDDDGLWDGQEVGVQDDDCPNTKTNPHKQDTDGDGLTDGEEDPDLDGCWEKEDGETNPLAADSDGDGLKDGIEITIGTDPLNKDSDEDTILDSTEVGSDVLNPVNTDSDDLIDALDTDSDDDTIPDAAEAGDDKLGTPPTDSDGDLVWDYRDLDSDADWIPDTVEAGDQDLDTPPVDSDNDDVPDFLDTDSDADYIADWSEAGDQDLDTPPVDSDLDDLPDYLDGDADGDTISDAHEAGDTQLETPPVDWDDDGQPDYLDLDTDADTILDADEAGDFDPATAPVDSDGDSTPDFRDPDSDGDSITDLIEAGDQDLLTAPVDSNDDGEPDYLDDDSDGDTISDFVEWNVDSDLDGVANPDADGDGTYNYLDEDSDDAQGPDQEEGTGDEDDDGIPNFVDPEFGPPEGLDSDGDGLPNVKELEIGTDPYNPDTDGDGLNDKQEVDGHTDPLDVDTDDDGLRDSDDGLEDSDGDGLMHALDPDSDNDGLFDGTERGVIDPWNGFSYQNEKGYDYDILGTDVSARNFEADQDPSTKTLHTTDDTDSDGINDGAEDPNHNGLVETGEMNPLDGENIGLTEDDIAKILEDDDKDGLTNRQEWSLGLKEADGDLDDDGVLDGHEHNWRCDTDLDGLRNLVDPDSDDDGLADGTERGMVAADISDWTELKFHNFVADGDSTTTTYMLLPDSDFDLARDGLEDLNHNGTVDDGESDPLDPEDTAQPADTDLDLLPDAEEEAVGLDPEDADTDDDGVLDGAEHNFAYDVDGDGLACAFDPDSDNDGLADGTEEGVNQPAVAGEQGTSIEAGNFVPDQDPGTTTYAMVADTDMGGVSDGTEDTDKDGQVDDGESDPLYQLDDSSACIDTDADLLCDDEETVVGTDPLDGDSDDDGLPDGLEHNWNFDTDFDGLINALDHDADGDFLPDGLEQGMAEPVAAFSADLDGQPVEVLGTALEAGLFVPDTDPASQTFMLVADSDRGGIGDGDEDLNGNGSVDGVDTDPLDPTDDTVIPDDIDGDGLLNILELAIGTDPYDKDSDGDFIPDNVEVGEDPANPLDSDEDGLIDALDDDSDADGIPDEVEAGDQDLETAPPDFDEDGSPDYLDLDSDDDTLPDADEWIVDADRDGEADTDVDGDGQYNYEDLDSDDGGVPDQQEVAPDRNTNPYDPEDDFKGWFEDGASIQGGVACSAGPRPGSGLAAGLLIALLLGLLLLLKRGSAASRIPPVLVAVALLCLPTTALADYHPDAKKTSLDGNYYRLVPDGKGIFSIHSDETLAHLEFMGGLSLHYVHNPLTVVVGGDVKRKLVGPRLESHLSAALGLFNLIDFGLQLPITLYQKAQYPGMNLGSLATTGIGNLALFAKIQALDARTKPVGLALYVPLFFPTGNDGAYMGYDGWGTMPTIVVSTRFDPVLISLNLAYHLQPETQILNIEDDDKFIIGLGVAYEPKDGMWEAGLEGTLGTNVFDFFGDAEEIQAEVDAGAKLRLGDFKVVAAVGAGIAPGFMTPAFRIFAGVEYARRPNPDRDGDGIENLADACPDNPEDFDGFKDDDGCPELDNDNDNILDDKDQCPNQPEDYDSYRDDDGCPDPDNDSDGIPDKTDRCPNEAEDMDKFEDEDGCPDLDNDLDGIPDKTDKCPNEKEVYNDYLDEDGCPDKKLAEFQKEARRIQILDKVHFKFMSAEIDKSSHEMLDQVAQILKDNPQVLFVQVEGHTDKTGGRAFNMALSLDRAKSVMEYMTGKGIDSSRLKAKGYGFDRRIDYRSGPEANLNNRRVEFNILKFEEPKK